MAPSRPLAALLLVALIGSTPAWAQHDLYNPEVAPASPEAGQAAKSFRLAPGLKIDLFASEPMLANPVAFTVDDRGRFYVAETFRLHAGVTDNRGHMNWLDADMASRSVEDRVAMYRKFLGLEGFAAYNVEHERVRMLVDADGDGKADRSTVFADGFKDAADGIGAGVLARKGDVYFTCIPDVWKLRDADGDGRAEVKESMSSGYGVHVAFLGHDLHGLRMGPDGRLYFSVGDRGLNVRTKEGKHLFLPDTGAVLRCEPDGSRLEIYASGLRNPQELAFDDAGNLFTGDNNSDGGDKARWVHLVEGGDSGWRMGYQYLDFPTSRGPWNAEAMWHPREPGQAAYFLPPIANLGDGPSGLAHDPGTGLPSRYRDHFFLADFRGGAGNSGIRSFANTPKGATFELVDTDQLAWSVLATDVEFGPDGAVYLSDWVNGWEKTGKGRIWKITPEQADPRSAEVKAILGEGMARRDPSALVALLSHPDQRVRQEAQFELADRAIPNDTRARQALEAAASDKAAPARTRIHAIWALGQIARRNGNALNPLAGLAGDKDPEVRAQAIKMLGETKAEPSGDRQIYAAALKDDAPRVRFFAAMALAHHPGGDNAGPLLDLLRTNDDADPMIRHAAVMALAALTEPRPLLAAAADPSAAVRLGALLAMRRQGRPEVARFLADKEPRLATEAALAIYEAPIDAALPALADGAADAGRPEAFARRAINAANRVGRIKDAAAIAATGR